jgi:HlyD family secretion protein
VRNGRAEFVPIKIGIAGDRYFEVLSGVKPADQVVTGPYNSVRGINDGDAVKVETPKPSTQRSQRALEGAQKLALLTDTLRGSAPFAASACRS